MLNPQPFVCPLTSASRPWDARLARRLVAPLVDSWVTPNYLTTLRLGVGLAAHWPILGAQWPLLAFAALIAGLIVYKHRGNLARLRAGTEHRFGTQS